MLKFYGYCYLILFFLAQLVSATELNQGGGACGTRAIDSPPSRLSQTCLYSDITGYTIASELYKYTPNYSLWSDGAKKSRWVYFPPEGQVNTDNMDRWVFPEGTQFFKEFRKTVTDDHGSSREIRIETRHLIKVSDGKGPSAWLMNTYAWLDDQSDALLSQGASNVLGTGHDIPTHDDCITCHKGNVDTILGFDAIQLSDVQGLSAVSHGADQRANGNTEVILTLQTLIDRKQLTTPPLELPRLPGSTLDQKALGYFHANCGTCHNPMGHAAERDAKHLILRHSVAFRQLQSTDVYNTAVNQRTRNFTVSPRIIMGAEYEELAVYKSAVFIRMNSLDEDYRMPMLASKQIDYAGLDMIHRWILTLETPEDEDEL